MDDITLTKKLNNIVRIGHLYEELERDEKESKKRLKDNRQSTIRELISTYESIQLFWGDQMSPTEIKEFKREFVCIFKLYFPDENILINDKI